jgi:photosystem II stability/assembly factor-like uncharacterized protein
MATLFVTTGNAIAVIRQHDGRWQASLSLDGQTTQCVAIDPLRPEHVYCGTFGQGLWRSRDAGLSWEQVGPGITSNEVMAVAVSTLERSGDQGVVWAGTEPSMLFRSDDGGQSWVERPTLKYLPSSPTWSFPPRPWTHHVRWIQPDPTVPDRIFVGIELGGVMRSLDGGLTWEDRKPGAQPDAHTLRAHRLAPGRVYEAAGGGFAETDDGGETWHGADTGFSWHYLWGLAIDPVDPNVAVVSVSPGPRHAHDARVSQAVAGHGAQGGPPWAGYSYQGPEAAIYRRVGQSPWQQMTQGLPNPRGTMAYVFATHETEPHVFYAAPHSGEIFRSADAGTSWERLDVMWPDGFTVKSVDSVAVGETP